MVLELLLVFLIICIHELGHYAGFVWFGYKPNLKLRWYGVVIGENINRDIRMEHAPWIAFLGIATGYFALLVMGASIIVILFYFISCYIDFTTLTIALSTKKEHWHLTSKQIDKIIVEEENGISIKP